MVGPGVLLSLVWLTSASPVYAPQVEPLHVPFAKTTSADWMVLVDATFNGKKTVPVILDTGAAAGVMERSVSKALGIQTKVEIPVTDGGGASVKAGLAMVDVAVGGATLSQTPFIILDLPDGAPAKAVVGVQLFQKYVVRVDFTHREVVLVPRESYQAGPKAVALPLSFAAGSRPVIEASVDGIKGQFLLDTGNNSALILNAGFVKAHDLTSKYRLLDRGDGGRTVIGKRASLIGRIGSLEVAGFTVKEPITAFLKNANQAESHLDGNIGMEVFRQFDVAFDLTGKTAYLEPNLNFGKRMAYERAGLVVEKAKMGYEVTNILPDSPADQAGVKVGDKVVSMGGKPLSVLDGIQRRQLLRQAPGTRLVVLLSRGGKRRTVTLVLRDLL